jgi:hypothetical protein
MRPTLFRHNTAHASFDAFVWRARDGHIRFEGQRPTEPKRHLVAKRLRDRYGARTLWLKIKNPSYSQNVGRRELFDRKRA